MMEALASEGAAYLYLKPGSGGGGLGYSQGEVLELERGLVKKTLSLKSMITLGPLNLES